MPGIITHYLFAMDCLDNIKNPLLKSLVTKNIEVFILGCKGPNIFCYNNSISFLNNKNISIYNNKIHTEYINDFFKNMVFYCNDISIIRNLFDDNFTEVSLSYLLGFLSHYALDTTTHPYLYSMQIKLSKYYKRKNANSLHQSIETHIDKLLLKKFKNLKPDDFNDFKKIQLNTNDTLIICDMYTFLLKKIYNTSLSYKDINKCIKVLRKTENYLNKKNTLHSKIYFKVKSLTSNHNFLESKIYSNHNHCINDLLNIQNTKWIDPFTKAHYNDSFEDLYEKSLILYDNLVTQLDMYLCNEASINSFLDIIGDKSYLTNQNYKVCSKYNY